MSNKIDAIPNEHKIISPEDIRLINTIKELLSYRAHTKFCKIDTTDVCTCGMKQAADQARKILKIYET